MNAANGRVFTVLTGRAGGLTLIQFCRDEDSAMLEDVIRGKI